MNKTIYQTLRPTRHGGKLHSVVCQCLMSLVYLFNIQCMILLKSHPTLDGAGGTIWRTFEAETQKKNVTSTNHQFCHVHYKICACP